MEPSVKILYSESANPKIQMGSIMSLGVANSLFELQDVLCGENNLMENVVYEISYFINGSMRTCTCSQNLGDGDGSVINHLRKNAIEVLEILNESNVQNNTFGSKNPLTILQTSYKNMLQYILPELEAYCVAYKTYDVMLSYNVDNCDKILLSDVSTIMSLVKNSPNEFVSLLDNVIEKNPDDLSLISSVEVIINKTEQYLTLVNDKEDYKDSVINVLREATNRATAINSQSVFFNFPEPDLSI